MPERGEIARGRDIGRADGRYLYDFCIDCGKGDWVQKARYGLRVRCRPCSIKDQKRTFMQKY